MILFAINLGLLTVLFFIVGMIKPKWSLFFLKEPSRFLVMAITMILVMISFTLYGEGIRRSKEEKQKETPAPKIQSIVPVPMPNTLPTAAPAK